MASAQVDALAPPSPTGTVRPSSARSRSLLGKLKPPHPKRLLRVGGHGRTNRAALLEPLDPNAPPLGVLVCRVLQGQGLVAKDKNGLSDPYVVIRYGDERATSSTVSKSLDPVWPADSATLRTVVYDSRGFGRERLEITVWDRDRISREYMGELSLGAADWWGDRTLWPAPDAPPVSFADSKPIWHSLSSTRAKTASQGSLLVQVGFVSAAQAGKTAAVSPSAGLLADHDRLRILEALQRTALEVEGARRESREERVLLSSPMEAVGMKETGDAQPLGLNLHDLHHRHHHAHRHPSETATRDEESPSSDEETDASTMTTSVGDGDTDDEDEDDESTDTSELNDAMDTLNLGTKPDVPFVEVSTSGSSTMRVPVPADSASDTASEPLPQVADQPGAPQSRSGRLFIPKFIKRTASAKSVPTLRSSKKESDAEEEESAASGAESALESAKSRRKRRLRMPSRQPSRQSTAESVSSVPAAAVKPRPRSKKLGRRRTKRDYHIEDDDDILGLAQIDVLEAESLPRWKNVLKTGYDMDPFVVVSFGRKVFRTKVVRHSLNPTWNQTLFFHVRQHQANWAVNFNVYDWDRASSNDHVGDASVALADLLGKTIQPDERGLYPATHEGKLAGDDMHPCTLRFRVPTDGHDELVTDSKHSPALHIRAKITPYDALRQQFWRTYVKQYDIDDSSTYSRLEVASVLDSLGSTLAKRTVDSFFTRFGKTIDDALTLDEIVLCLESELKKPLEDKREAEDAESLSSATDELQDAFHDGVLAAAKSEMVRPHHHSHNTKLVPPGEVRVTNPELHHAVQQTMPAHPSSRDTLVRKDSPSDREDESIQFDEPVKLERVINIRECPLCHKRRMNSKAELDIVTHMAICASTDPRALNRILVSNYVTAPQAQRKWVTKMISKATKGSYQLGRNNANIIVQDRRTGALIEERMAIYVRLGMRLAYQGFGARGGLDSQRMQRLLKSLTVKQGVKYDAPASVRDIAPFIEFHNLNMDEARDPVSSFRTFNDFFYRRLKEGARPADSPHDPGVLVSPADCRAMFFESVTEATKIWIKGRDFTVGKLLGEGFQDRAAKYENGSLAIFRLAPQDYHRYHCPVDGVCGYQQKIEGQYYTVCVANPMAIRGSIDVYGENVRLVMPIVSPKFKETAMVFVGAMMVGSIIMTVREGDPVQRADELGYFAFGGSTIVCLWEPGVVRFDEDLVENSRHSLETLVRVGMRIGVAT